MLKRPKVPPTLFDALLSSSSSSLELVPVVLLLLDDVVDLELVFGLDEASTPFRPTRRGNPLSQTAIIGASWIRRSGQMDEV